MGRAITYCVQCSARVSDADLETGKGFRVGDRILCKACAPDSVKIQTTKKVPRPKDASTSVALKALPAPPPATPVDVDLRKKMILFGAGGAAVAVLILVVLMLVFRRGDAPPPPPVAGPGSTGTPEPADPAAAKAAAGRADLEKARAFAKAHPEDLAAALKEFNDLVWKWEGTDAATEAAKEAAAVKAEILEKVKVWMAEVETQIQGLVEKKEYRAAARKVEELKPTHTLLQWNLAVEKRASELYADARREEDRRAEEAARAAAAEPPKPVERTPSEEAKGYPAKWEPVLVRATGRDFAGAIADLQRLAAGVKDADVRAEAAQDLKDLQGIAALHQASLEALKKKPRGSGLTLLVRQPSGEPKKIGGLILQIDAERVEVSGAKGSSFVEWDEVASPTLAAAASKPDARLQAQLCLLDGEVEAARAYPAELGRKWWDYGAKARGFLPKPDPGEKSAREVYYQAERGFRSMETRAAAIEAYKTLRTDFGSTALVKAYSERIARRTEAGKEYYFAGPDFRAEGTFRLSKAGKLESTKDSDDIDTLRNSAELEFAALAGVAYRCWLLAGACCEETFLFYLQGTEVADTDRKTGKKIPCEPGTTTASPVKHSIRGLKKTHAEHKVKGAKEHPKTAARWEWIEIPLPKYAAAGGKKLRFMTNQAGFSVGGAVVSSTRKAAPVEAELKDLEKDREVVEGLPVDRDLVAWWGFEEAGGSAAADLTGNGHEARVVGSVQWVDGKLGGGVRFSGADSALRVEDAEDLRLPGDLTLALWMKKEGDAGDWSCLIGKGQGQQRNYCLWLETKTANILFQEYGPAAVNLKTKFAVPDGTWTHIAATVEGGKATVYVNGVKESEVARPGPASVVNFPLGMGFACEHGSYKGVLDDVRVYRRGLSAAEIQALYDQAR